jgi:hypothetical protein
MATYVCNELALQRVAQENAGSKLSSLRSTTPQRSQIRIRISVRSISRRHRMNRSGASARLRIKVRFKN